MIANSGRESKSKIDKIEKTADCLTSRSGLSFIVRYIEKINIYPVLERYFGALRSSRKGIPVKELFKQILCFFTDGTSFHLTRFDELAKDAGYACTIETAPESMASSHQIKRFFNGFSFMRNYLFRRLLQELFSWRLNITRPAAIILDLDTMVMANDDASKREGVKPTYKKVKGFQPLLMKWQGYVIDAVFRGGSKHSNYSDTVIKMVKHIVKLIRKKCGHNVPIILKSDSGFYDRENYKAFEALGIGYIIGGRIYDDIREYAENSPGEKWITIEKENQEWEVLEFESRRDSWNKSRRAIFTRPLYEDRQQLFPFARPERIWYTNLGRGETIDELLADVGLSHYAGIQEIVDMAHERGADELVHREIKDFGAEQLPFKRFESNTAFFYMMLLSFNLVEAFKEDVSRDVIPQVCYATTFRRRFIDTAGKIVKSAGRTILKVTGSVWETLKVERLWKLANSPPVLS